MNEHYLITASKVIFNVAGASLLVTLSVCCFYLTEASIRVILSPDYNCTPVEINDRN